MPKMNSKYFAYASNFDFALMAGVIAIVLIGGYIVIQSIFRISINDKIKSYGQLRTIGATPKHQADCKGRGVNSAVSDFDSGTCQVYAAVFLFPRGLMLFPMATIILTLIMSWIMVSVSIRKADKNCGRDSPIEAVRFHPGTKGHQAKDVVQSCFNGNCEF